MMMVGEQKPADVRNASPIPFKTRLLVNKRLTPEDWFQETRHLEWDISGFPCHPAAATAGGQEEGQNEVQVAYQAGDVALVYPENTSSTVKAFLELMNLKEDDVLRISLSKESLVSKFPLLAWFTTITWISHSNAFSCFRHLLILLRWTYRPHAQHVDYFAGI